MPETALRTKLIIADDEYAVRLLLTRQLTTAGYEVVACEDGQSALDALREQGAGLLIADWQMPGLDGLALCRAIREQCEMQALGLVYFILLTAHCDKQRIVEGFAAGADDYLTKPYHVQELLARIRAGERILALQNELIQGRLEVNKMNAEMARLNAKLERLANTDTLTGLHNRRFVLDRVREAWALTERCGTPLGCIMLDIDRFKGVNDTYGHHVGDLVLKTVAGTIKGLLRRYDICGRFGGEEFVIFCPGTPLEGTTVLAERLRAAVSEIELPLENGTRLRVTLSAGAAVRTDSDGSPEALIRSADELLYKAKENGRDQVWFTPQPGVPGRFRATPTPALTG